MAAGGALAPLSSLHIESGEHVVLPETAWSREGLLSCLAEIATGQAPAAELPPDPSDDALLQEMTVPMETEALHATFEALATASTAPHMGSVIRMLVQLARYVHPS